MTDQNIPAEAGREGTSPEEPEALREQIEQTREELSEAVEALAAKADVKGTAQARVAQLQARARTKAAQLAELAQADTSPAAQVSRQRAVSGLAVVAAVVALVLVRRRSAQEVAVRRVIWGAVPATAALRAARRGGHARKKQGSTFPTPASRLRLGPGNVIGRMRRRGQSWQQGSLRRTRPGARR
jgi:phage I-like protein